MKIHRVLAVVLCCLPLLSLVEGQDVGSAMNMMPFGIGLRLLDPRNLLCFQAGLAKLVLRAPALTFELFACTKEYAVMTMKLGDSLKQIVAIATPIVSTCASVALNGALGGIGCVKEAASRTMDLIAVMKRFQDDLFGMPRNATQCVSQSFQKFFGVSSIYEMINGCLFHKN